MARRFGAIGTFGGDPSDDEPWRAVKSADGPRLSSSPRPSKKRSSSPPKTSSSPSTISRSRSTQSPRRVTNRIKAEPSSPPQPVRPVSPALPVGQQKKIRSGPRVGALQSPPIPPPPICWEGLRVQEYQEQQCQVLHQGSLAANSWSLYSSMILDYPYNVIEIGNVQYLLLHEVAASRGKKILTLRNDLHARGILYRDLSPAEEDFLVLISFTKSRSDAVQLTVTPLLACLPFLEDSVSLQQPPPSISPDSVLPTSPSLHEEANPQDSSSSSSSTTSFSTKSAHLSPSSITNKSLPQQVVKPPLARTQVAIASSSKPWTPPRLAPAVFKAPAGRHISVYDPSVAPSESGLSKMRQFEFLGSSLLELKELLAVKFPILGPCSRIAIFAIDVPSQKKTAILTDADVAQIGPIQVIKAEVR